jgi:UDP-GlcNAc:undecaprenyl-phosphate GlcNAc-1-phosphate transferase
MILLVAFFLALAITIALIPPLMKGAVRLAIVDVPDERKVHSGAVPRVGGIAMIVGAIVPMMLWLQLDSTLTGLLAALAVLLFFGAWDDSRDLDYRLKFLGQLLAASAVIFIGNVKLGVLPFAGLDPVSDFISIPLTLVFLIGITNAINLSDGLDGLAAGLSFLSLCGIALLAYLADAADIVLMCFAVAGVVFGFLRYNTFPARIFMGDTGSQFLGFVIAVLAIILTQKSNTALNPLLPLFLVGIPVIDTLLVMYRRIRAGRSLFSPDKNHLHHRLLAAGLKHYEAVSFIYLAQIVFVVSAILVRYDSDLAAGAIYLALSVAVVVLMQFFSRRGWQGEGAYLSAFVTGIDRNSRIGGFACKAIGCGLGLYLVFYAVVPAHVPIDLQLSSAFLLALLLVRLVWSSTLRFLPLRLLVFPAIAFIVYLVHYDAQASTVMPPLARIALLILLITFVLLAIRYTRNDSFQTTPTDILVIAMIGGVGVMYERNIVDAELAPMVVELVLLFYAAELFMRQMRSAWNCFTVGILAALAFLSARLLL